MSKTTMQCSNRLNPFFANRHQAERAKYEALDAAGTQKLRIKQARQGK